MARNESLLISRTISCPCGWQYGPNVRLRTGDYKLAEHKMKCAVINPRAIMDLTKGKVIR